MQSQTLPTAQEVDAIHDRYQTNCKLLGREPTGNLLTTDQAAEICGFTRKTLEQKRIDGNGPAYIRLMGSKSIRYPEPLLLDWIVAGLRTNTDAA